MYLLLISAHNTYLNKQLLICSRTQTRALSNRLHKLRYETKQWHLNNETASCSRAHTDKASVRLIHYMDTAAVTGHLLDCNICSHFHN